MTSIEQIALTGAMFALNLIERELESKDDQQKALTMMRELLASDVLDLRREMQARLDARRADANAIGALGGDTPPVYPPKKR
jgi:hypothetical protein